MEVLPDHWQSISAALLIGVSIGALWSLHRARSGSQARWPGWVGLALLGPIIAFGLHLVLAQAACFDDAYISLRYSWNFAEGNGLTFRRDVWIRYAASCTGVATASVCDSDFNTKLAVYDARACPGKIIACSDDACGEEGTRSEVTFDVGQGEEYLVRIGGRTFIGTGTLVLSCEEGQ